MQIQNDLQFSLHPPTSVSTACVTQCWEMHLVSYLAKLSHSTLDHLNKARLSWAAPWNAPGPRNYDYSLLHPQSPSLSLALLSLAAAQLRRFSPPGKDGNKMLDGRCVRVVNTGSLLLTLLSLVSGWEEFRDDKELACCLSKTKLQNPRMTLLYLCLTLIILWVYFYA